MTNKQSQGAHAQPQATPSNQATDYLLPRKTVEKLSGLSRASIYRLIKINKFPRPVNIGTGSVRWKQSDVVAWQSSLTKTA